MRDLLGDESLAEASTWADFMRSSKDPFWRQAAPWHYVTVPPGQRYEAHKAPAPGDAVTALTAFRETLRKPSAPRDERRRALRFAIHVVADLHQPLHAGNGRDRGGSGFPVFFFQRLTNLHRVWDVHLPEHEGLSYTEFSAWLVRRLEPQTVAEWSRTDLSDWIGESVQLRDLIYPARNARLTWGYVYEHREQMRHRLLQGGVRTAVWLHRTFTDSQGSPESPPVSCP